MRAIALLAVFAPLCLVQPEPHSPKELCAITPKFSYYDVHGLTSAEVRQSLLANGPQDQHGNRRFAFTDWSINWRWEQDAHKKVDLKSLRISCAAEIQLPRLVVTKDTPVDLIRSWHSFVERTRQHELAHVRHAEAGAPKIRHRLGRIEARKGPLSPTEATKEVLAVVAEARAMDREYDLRTNHGSCEGTWMIEVDRHG